MCVCACACAMCVQHVIVELRLITGYYAYQPSTPEVFQEAGGL